MSNNTYQLSLYICPHRHLGSRVPGTHVGSTSPAGPREVCSGLHAFSVLCRTHGPIPRLKLGPMDPQSQVRCSQEGMIKEPHWRGEKEHLGTKSMVKDMYNPLQGESKALQLHSQSQRRSEAAAGVCRTPPSCPASLWLVREPG